MKLPERGRQTMLAKRFGVSQQAAKKWLDGRTYPETDKLLAMAEWADVNINWLMQGSGPKHGDRIQTKVLVLDEALRSLPSEERRETLNFIRYKLEQSRAVLTSERLARYEKMLETFDPPPGKPPQ
jgi:transcriptional regulator with XRE-family HTH domain